jgi:hypothetical protein
MGHEAMKLELIKWLTNLDNETIEYLKIVKDSRDSIEGEDPQIIEGLNRAAKDIDNGLVVSHDVVSKKYGL